MSDETLDAIFEDVDKPDPIYPFPHDGYRAVLQPVGSEIGDVPSIVRLIVFFTAQGVCVWDVCVHEEGVDPDNSGAWQSGTNAQRLLWPWRSLCGFLNAGGDVTEFVSTFVSPFYAGAMETQLPSIRDIFDEDPQIHRLVPLLPPEGFALLSTGLDENAEHYEHVFLHEDGERVLVWHEDVTIEETTVTALNELEDLADEAEEDDIDIGTDPAELLGTDDNEAEKEN